MVLIDFDRFFLNLSQILTSNKEFIHCIVQILIPGKKRHKIHYLLVETQLRCIAWLFHFNLHKTI